MIVLSSICIFNFETSSIMSNQRLVHARRRIQEEILQYLRKPTYQILGRVLEFLKFSSEG